LLLGALASLGAFLVLTVVVTQNGFDAVDRVARALVHWYCCAPLRISMEAASFLGGQPGQVTVVILGSALLGRRQRVWGVAFPFVMAGAGLLQIVAKWAIDRPRPNLDPWGFPSAHVLTVVVISGYLAYALGAARGRSWRRFDLAICAAIVGTVAFSRMYLDAHWFSDVLGGLSIGLAYLLAVVWLIGSIPPGRSEAYGDPGAHERSGVYADAVVKAEVVVVAREPIAVERVAATHLEADVP
jgi:undecaprenyl-diphosphatase